MQKLLWIESCKKEQALLLIWVLWNCHNNNNLTLNSSNNKYLKGELVNYSDPS